MTRLILVRHGVTVWNHDLRYQGQTDVALAEEGYRQARLLTARLEKEKIDAIYASDLSRALETAKIVAAARSLPVQAMPELREISFGAWEGLTHQEIEERYPDLMQVWASTPSRCCIPGGESFAQVRERAYGAVLKLVARHDNESILVVSHGAANRMIISGILGLEIDRSWQIRQDNTAVNIIDFYDGVGIVRLLNDIRHLDDCESPGW